MTNDDTSDGARSNGRWLTRRSLIATLIAAPLATCVSLSNEQPVPTCGRGRSPDICADFQKFRVDRYNRNY
jgi:hypothetical protein